MIELERSQCAVLPLVLKGEWFDMIASGEKREEYRLSTDYWRKRFLNWDCRFSDVIAPIVEFRRGYSTDAPRMAFYTLGQNTASGLKIYSYSIDSRHPEWGEPTEPHFVILLGDRVSLRS